LVAVDAFERVDHARAFAGDREAHFDAPFLVATMHGELRAGGPRHAFTILAMINFQHSSCGVDGNLVVTVGRSLDEQRDVIA